MANWFLNFRLGSRVINTNVNQAMIYLMSPIAGLTYRIGMEPYPGSISFGNKKGTYYGAFVLFGFVL